MKMFYKGINNTFFIIQFVFWTLKNIFIQYFLQSQYPEFDESG